MYSTPQGSQFRRPWSPEPFEPLQLHSSGLQDETDFDPYNQHPTDVWQPRRREASDVSVEALDLADYARTLRIAHPQDLHDPASYPIYPPYPPSMRPLASQDTLQPPSLSRGGTRSTQSQASSSRSRSRPFSLPSQLRDYRTTANRFSHSYSPRLAEPRIQPHDAEIDASHFPAWSRSWYDSRNAALASPPDIYTPLPVSHFNSTTKRSPFDPGYMHRDSPDFSDPYRTSIGHESARDLLPWSNDPLDDQPIGSTLKQERMRMLEHEFGSNTRDKIRADDGPFIDENGKPLLGTVDSNGNLVTQGPKKRIAVRMLQILLSLIAAIPSIYAALAIKPKETPPPAGKPPAFVLYVFSVVTTLLLFYLFLFRPCCCVRNPSKNLHQNPLNGMMVLPVEGLPGGKKGKRKAARGKVAGQGDLQVNLIMDPDAFERAEEHSEDDNDRGWDGSIPGSYGSPKKRRRPRRRSVFAGLAMEESWKRARSWAKKLAFVDVLGLLLWGATFVFILIGKRCPSGGFDGWCNAYNISSAAACLLCLTFDIEALVLSGELFNGPERSSSPRRSPSPDAGWHDEEISEEAKRRQNQGLDYDSDEERRDIQKAQEDFGESIGMGPGRTGVKGVIRDRDEAEMLENEKRFRDVEELQKKMEKSNLGGKTFLEEEREKGPDDNVDDLVLKEREAMERRKDVFGRVKEGKFGHLREVGAKGFLIGVEEERGVWVVVHLYDSSLERCYLVDETLARLARLHPDTKFLRARAATLGFASKSSAPSRSRRPIQDDDEDDPYADEDEGEENINDDSSVDLDMLPTMLVYRDGELVHNWVRVDWEAGRASIEELLDQHGVLPRSESILGGNNLGLPSDEDDDDDFDLLWSDDDDVDHKN
ncbi:hypothetical protein H0H81_009838 [Sphagnurus paluster]|uniref:Phosducin thioredoxin-like domain-containing protein n=1 Tax=Sphagnurus paluster TaxID=117069 RepID=A0A9P7GI86_9AGAR|nr:hypothetical protein H0H81_009838 [Sphagnurus paluster]